MSDERQQFLDQILAEPDNDEPRLVYADWLLDRGDPRGEFIQLQCARQHLPEFSAEAYAMRQRERELLREHGDEWAKELEGLLYRYEFRRGFIEWGRVNTDRFIETAPQLFQLTPLQHVMFARGEVNQKLAKCAELKQLKSICFSKCRTNHLQMLEVLESPHTKNVTNLGFAEVGDVPLRRVVAAKPRLESLYFTQVSFRGFTAWLDRGELPPLRSLRLKGGDFDQRESHPDVMRRIDESSLPSRLEEFSYCEWDDRASDLTRFNNWPRLRKLEISLPTAAAVMKLSECTARLESLSIEAYAHRGITLPPSRFRQLLDSPMLENLRLLRVLGIVTDDHAFELAKWDRLKQLYRLNLSSNSMTFDGLRILLHAIPPERRIHCDLRSNAAGVAGVHRLLEEFGPELGRCVSGTGGWQLVDTQGRDWSGAKLTLQ